MGHIAQVAGLSAHRVTTDPSCHLAVSESTLSGVGIIAFLNRRRRPDPHLRNSGSLRDIDAMPALPVAGLLPLDSPMSHRLWGYSTLARREPTFEKRRDRTTNRIVADTKTASPQMLARYTQPLLLTAPS